MDRENDASQSLNLEIDELDEKEFDLPSVEEPPTLESILNAPDDVLDIGTQNLLQGEPSDTASVASQDGILGDGKSKKKAKKSVRYEQHGSVLRHVALKGVSAQIQSAIEKVDAGMTTAMDVSAQIAVGTSHGLVLVFDPRQVLKWCLGSTSVGAEYGAVSAVSFNHDCTRLLVGFAKGQLTMWDLTQGKLIRTITDAHPPGTAILHVKFTDDPTLAVCSDSGGSVFELEFKRIMGVRSCESRCLFSGSRGEVCCIEPLHTSHISEDHPMKDVIILAMASLSKVLIVTLRPHLKVIYTQLLKGDAATLPLLAWQFVMIQVSTHSRVMDPVLAFARDHTIHFYQRPLHDRISTNVVCHGPDDIQFSQLQKTDVPYKLLALTWVNSRTLVAIDTTERAHVLDVRSEEELEVIDLVDVQLVYSTSFYKSLATGGNVSKALAYAGERACYQSVVSYNGQLILLGTKAIHVMTLRTWKERIDVLLKHSDYQGALSMGLRFYKGEAKGMVGLLGSPQKRKQDISDRLLEVLLEYVDVSMTTNCPGHGKLELLEEYYQNVVPVCVENCLTLNRVDVLFGEIFERFSSDVIAKGVFLECLEPYILSDKLTSVTPVVMKEFVEHYQERGMLSNLESCIVHMDIASLDLHQVVSMCRANGLYDAIMYIYNTGMVDYVTPLEELLLQLQKAVSTGKQLSDESIKMGNKMLVYISCSMAGLAYPRGEIPANLKSKVKDEVFKCVTCLHTKDHPEDEPTYPHLRTLLHFDTREFFNVLSLAFEEPEFNEGEGVDKRQRVIDILIQIMVEGSGFSPTQVGILFTFLARQIARHPDILVNRMLFEQVLEALANPSEESRHEERQQALLELLSAGGLQQFNESRLLHLAEEAKFYQVCELLYERNRQFDKIVLCYSQDPTRKHQVFYYAEHVMLSQQFSVEEKKAVEKQVLSSIKDFVEIDSLRTAQLVLGVFSSHLTDVVNRLAESEDLLYKFLSGVLDVGEHTGVPSYQERQVAVDPVIHECYIGLMCKREPQRVCGYLQAAEGYRVQETLEVCKHYKIADATAYLLEKVGDIQGAFDIMLQDIKIKLQEYTAKLTKLSADDQDQDEISQSWSTVKNFLGNLVQLCQRHSPKMEEPQRQALWFPLLETLMATQRELKDVANKQHLDDMKAETSQVLNSMMSFIALPAILQKIMQDPSYSSGKFGEIKELILGMLETYNYEKTLLKTCNSLVSHDLHVHLVALTAAASRGLSLRAQSCCLCSRSFNVTKDNDMILGFRCGHGYHQPCLKAVGSCVILDGEELWMCYLCNKAKRSTGHSTSRIRLSSSSSSTLHNSLTTLPGFSRSNTTSEGELEPEQIFAIDNLRRIQKTHSRLAILNELSKADTKGWRSSTSTNILQNEHFQLRVAAPPPQF